MPSLSFLLRGCAGMAALVTLSACGGSGEATSTPAPPVTIPPSDGGGSTPTPSPSPSPSPSPTTVYSEVALETRATWPGIDLIDVLGGVGVRIAGTIENSSIGPVAIKGAKFGIYTDKEAVVHDLTIKDVAADNLEREGIRLRGDVQNIGISDFHLQMRDTPQTSPNLPEGIAIYEGQNITISDGEVSGFQMVVKPDKYTNGDGIAVERAVDNLVIKNVTASDNSDGGFDLKSSNTYLYDTLAERNKRNYRFWGTVEAGTITSVDPKTPEGGAHVWAGNGAEVVIDKLIARSTTKAPIVYIEGAKSVTIRECELDVPEGTMFLKGGFGAIVKFGEGCAL